MKKMSLIMENYSIKDLERLSGIKSHTIRIWEQRYQIFNPERTSTNIRFYSEKDVKQLLNIIALQGLGYKISKINTLSEEQINGILLQNNTCLDFGETIQNLTLSVIQLDEKTFYDIVKSQIHKVGIERVLSELFYSFAQKIMNLWKLGMVSNFQRKFAHVLLTQFIFSEINSLIIKSNDSKKSKFLIFLPTQSCDEIGLLICNYLLRQYKNEVLYLGDTISIEELPIAVSCYQPEYIVLGSTIHYSRQEVIDYINAIRERFPTQKTIAFGLPKSDQSKCCSHVFWIENPKEMLHWLDVERKE